MSDEVEEAIEAKLKELDDLDPSEVATSLLGWTSTGIQDVPVQKRSGAKWQPANVYLFEHVGNYGWLR